MYENTRNPHPQQSTQREVNFENDDVMNFLFDYLVITFNKINKAF